MIQKSETNNESEELKVLKNEVDVLSAKLQESEMFKSHFLSNIRNALVNPFSSVIGLSGEIIKSDLHDWKRVIKLAALIHSEAFDLDFQLSNIFCTAELEAGEKQLDICEVEIKELIESCIQSFNYLVRKKNIRINISAQYGREVFRTDPTVISIIIRNLIHNSIQYNQKAGTVMVIINLGSNLKITVKDEGIGMSEEELKYIFSRFTRGDRQINSLQNGHGLGLPIIKNLIDMMGGEIKYKSQSGKGSSFTFLLPESQETETSKNTSVDEASSGAFIF